MVALMLFSAFTFGACDGGPEEPEIPQEITTINIYGIKGDDTTDEAIAAVEKELSLISYRKHELNVKLLLFTEEEYASIVFAKVERELTKLGKETKYSNNLYVSDRVSSDVANSSMDIFLVYTPKLDSAVFDRNSKYYSPALANGGMFNALYENEAVLGLNTYLNNANYKVLATNAYADALEAAKMVKYDSQSKSESALKPADYDVFGVPNNIIYGGYEFCIVDGTYVDKYFQFEDKNDIFSFSSGDGALNAVIDDLRGYKDKGEIPSDVEIKKEFASYEEFNDYIRNGKKFCIATVKGSLAVKELCSQSGRYEVYQKSVDTISKEELYESMFCISPFISSARAAQAVDILILLNTNAEFHNMFQYGIKDSHYTLGRDGVAHITGTAKNTYKMDPLYCGNMFIGYPSDNMGVELQNLALNDWKLGRKQVDDVLVQYRKTK